MITRLTIQHYRSIEDLDLRLGPVNVLVGRNGAGKSNIIDAIRFVRDALRHGLDHAVTQRHGIANIRQWSAGRPYNISIGMNVEHLHDDGETKDCINFSFTLASSRDGVYIHRERLWAKLYLLLTGEDGVRNYVPFEVSYDRDQHGNVNVIQGDDKYDVRLDDMGEFAVSFRYITFSKLIISRLSDFEAYSIFPNTLRQPQKQSTEVFLESHGGNLSSVLKRMTKGKRSDSVADIIESMKSVIKDLEGIPIQSVGGFIVPRFRIYSLSSDKFHTFDVDQLSDGSLRVLGLLVALYQDPRPATIALEEPEQTVHPGALQIIADSIAEVSGTTQVLVTTHSPDFLDRIDPAQVIAVDYIDEKTVARPLAQSQVDAVRNNLFSLGQLMSIEGLHG